MKTILRYSIMLTITAALCLYLGVAAYAEGTVTASGTCGANGDNLTWTLYDTGELVIDGTGNMQEFNEGTAPWYKNRLSITSVTIRNGVTSVGSYAFYYCIKLTDVSIPAGVASIGSYAFDNCIKLSALVIPEGVTSIGEHAFQDCSSLTSVTIPEGVTSIEWYAFNGCSSLTSVTIPESVTSINDDTFSGCSSLTSVTIPEGVTSIGSYAFYGCSSLTSVTIPESVTSIGGSAFDGCSSLTSVTIPESVTRIGSCAFYGCSSLTSVTIPEGVTSIYSSSFYGCSSLTSVTIPDSVTSIENYAFDRCSKLTDVYYGGSEAQWELISIEGGNNPLTSAAIHYGLIPQTYTISYDANGGTDAPGAQTKTQNIALTLSDVRPTRGNTSLGSYSVRLNPNDGSQSVSILRAARTVSYTFRTWNTKADGSGTDYAPGANYTTDADLTLYAQWDSTTATAAVTLPELARDGALFLGWAPSRDAESGVMGEYTPSGNVTLYAVWLTPDFVLPASLTRIDSEAFYGGAFSYVLVPAGVARINSGAFSNCPNLRYVEIQGMKTAISDNAFGGRTDFTIIAPADSAAATWANQHGVNFIPAA